MSEQELKVEKKPDLHLVRRDELPALDVASCFNALIAALSDVHMQDAELRQLWLETHWLKADYEHGVLSLPTNWELMIMQITRGHASSSVHCYPQVMRCAADLGKAIKSHVKKQFGE